MGSLVPHTQWNYFRRLTTLVMACRIIPPAFSTSFRDRPTVTHTFNAGEGCQWFGSRRPAGVVVAEGMRRRWVMNTPLASVCMNKRRGRPVSEYMF